MQRPEYSMETASQKGIEPKQEIPPDLRLAASGGATLTEAIQTLVHHKELQARAASDLHERETWALTTILAAAEPIWENLASPTLRFLPSHPGGTGEYYIELGRFSHLQGLIDPSADEQALIASNRICFARVYPHHDRQLAGQTGALGCSYVAMATAAAVDALGFGRIVGQIEAATGRASVAMLAEAQAQSERYTRLEQVERMLGWDPDPATLEPELPMRTSVLLALLDNRGQVALGAAGLGLVTVLLCFLVGVPHALLVMLVAGSALIIWNRAA